MIKKNITNFNKKNYLLKYIDKIFYKIKNTINIKYNDLSFLIPLLNYLQFNSLILYLLIIFIIFYFSNILLNCVYIILIFDTIISALFVLENISLKFYSQKISLNVLKLCFLFINPFNVFLTIILYYLIKNNYKPIIKKKIHYLIKIFLRFLFTNIIFLQSIYSDYKLL